MVWDERYGPVKVVHRSENFLIVNKPYDMYINSDNPDRKVSLLMCETYVRYLYKSDVVLPEHPPVGIKTDATKLG